MDHLQEIGFKTVGYWKLVNGEPEYELTDLAKAKNVIYAFVSNSGVKYIGKTTMTLKKRMYGYQKPGPTQSTNIKNNRRITEILSKGKAVDILAFADNGLLSYAGLHINLAAGLEDALIEDLNPEWNRKRANSDVVITKPKLIQSSKCETSGVSGRGPASSKKPYRGKFCALKEYLTGKNDADSVTLTFNEVEKIADAKLPKSASKYREWWANSGDTQACAWMQAGWLVDTVVLGESVTLRRFKI